MVLETTSKLYEKYLLDGMFGTKDQKKILINSFLFKILKTYFKNVLHSVGTFRLSD